MRTIHVVLTTDDKESDTRFIAQDIATELNCACTYFNSYVIWEAGIPVRYYLTDGPVSDIEERKEDENEY